VVLATGRQIDEGFDRPLGDRLGHGVRSCERWHRRREVWRRAVHRERPRAGVLARRSYATAWHPKRGLGLMEQGASFRRPGTATHFFGPTFIGSFSAFAASLRAA
jgi:hypothetical protein